MENVITAERVRQLLAYDPATGIFTRALARRGWKAGEQVGHIDSHGYVHGTWPSGLIDHIDGDRQNNRIANLREADNGLNSRNRHRVCRRNKSGHLGVFLRHRDGRYIATISACGKRRFLGSFETAEEAAHAYRAARAESDGGRS